MCTCKVPCSDSSGNVTYRPCGKCLECLQMYQQDWTSRLSEEVKAWDPQSIIFFTLTYAEDMLPVKVTVDHSSIRLCYDSPYCFNSRLGCIDSVKDFLSSHLGLDLFTFTRSLKDTNKDFIAERKSICDSYLDMPLDERPAIAAPTVCYDDVNTWIRYCRKWHDRNVVTVAYKNRRVSPYLKSLNFINVHNVCSDFPDSAYTPSFKYFITSEYGPRTLRPHYHGVLFGVTEDEFRNVFAPYWRDKFGCGSRRSVKFEVFNPEKGGALYVTKYCAKGSFEHPLCSKSVHNRNGKDFVFKDYIKVKDWFDFDFPLVTPTFHLISKGIGIRYSFNADVQRYWHVQNDEFTNFVTIDMPQLGDKYIPSPVDLLHKLPSGTTNKFIFPYKEDTCLDVVEEVYCVIKYDSGKDNKRILGKSFIYLDSQRKLDDFLVFTNSKYNKQYVRTYYHEGKTKTYSSLLPRYYRRFLLSPFSQSALALHSECLSNDEFNREQRDFRLIRSENEKVAFLERKAFSKSVKRSIAAKRISDRFNKFYDNTFAGDL